MTLERHGFTLIMEEVPAEICNNCGEDYIEDTVADEIMTIAENLSKTGSKIEVRKYGSGLEVSSSSSPGKFEVYSDKAGKYRFRLKAPNGEIIVVSESYNSKAACMNAIDSIKKNVANATVSN
ncbi:MAG TPA: DUF1508 domain-containing protein [Methanoregulaceae archaeon]|nr:DUF1508 domain-containing protein [Methanoregulaceae archaeon]